MTPFEDHLRRAVLGAAEMLADRTEGLETACITEDGAPAPIGAVELSMEIHTVHGPYRVTSKIEQVEDEEDDQ